MTIEKYIVKLSPINSYPSHDTDLLLQALDGMQLIAVQRPSMYKRLYKFISTLDPIMISLSITTIAFCGFLWKSIKWDSHVPKADKNVQTDRQESENQDVESESDDKQVIAID